LERRDFVRILSEQALQPIARQRRSPVDRGVTRWRRALNLDSERLDPIAHVLTQSLDSE